MCGIVGIHSFKPTVSDYELSVKNALCKLAKRGPDASGLVSFHKTILAHARLSIIDVSAAASQPFTDNSGRYTIVFNGEFFNYKEHRNNLIDRGITFKSESDTEVLLELFKIYGEAAIEKINGFFAFALYDKQEDELHVYRDRYGVKPLYYYKDDSKFIFASELKALLEFDIPRKIDSDSLRQYFHLNYIPSPYSIFKNVQKLEPGCFITIKNDTLTRRTYYQLPITEHHPAIEYESAKKYIHDTLEDAVKLRLVSDVPLGSFLSGGIDSSVITALAAKHVPGLNTFSIGFKDEPFFDETRYAEMVAKKHGTHHHAFKLSNDDFFKHLYGVLDYLDEPFADSSALNVFILSKETQKHVTVALSGDGADELFAGYNKHRADWMIRHNTTVNSLVKSISPFTKLMPQSRNSKLGNKFRQFNKYAEAASLSNADRYWRLAGFTSEHDLTVLLKNGTVHTGYSQRKNQLLAELNASTNFNAFLHTDMRLVLEGDMLVKVDRMSMANSLEIRTPFLDYRLVDYAMSLPSSYKIDKTHRKKIILDSFSYLLPKELLLRKKQGFETPLLKWLRTDLLSKIENEWLSESFIVEQNIFNYSAVKALLHQLKSSNPNDSVARIWALIVFQHWYKRTMF